MKVLFISGGRRVTLAQHFINAGFEIFAYETELDAPISVVGTIIPGKVWADKSIVLHLSETIEKLKPDLVIPLSDRATKILSSINYQNIVTSSEETNSICLNKKHMEDVFKVETFYPNPIPGQFVILKPIYGANSKGIIKNIAYNDYVSKKTEYDKTYIAQQQIESDFEISVDTYFNKSSEMIDAVPRKRIDVSGGEVIRSSTLSRDNSFGVIDLVRKIGKQIKLVGPTCVQFIINEEIHKAYLMEINARFGGGVTLSLTAGFNQIELLKKEWINNEIIKPSEIAWKSNLNMIRYFSDTFEQEYEHKTISNINISGKMKDISEERFGKLTAIYPIEKTKLGLKWYCYCDCGNDAIVEKRSLLNGHTTSCGCNSKLPEGVSNCHSLYTSYQRRAKSKKLEFDISEIAFGKITKENCFYCGVGPKQFYNKNDTNKGYLYNGLDRINPNIGYVETNIVPCCGRCNYSKLDMTSDEFKEFITTVYQYWINGKIQ
jgi:carbamoyl-phosphate synthase large subunit